MRRSAPPRRAIPRGDAGGCCRCDVIEGHRRSGGGGGHTGA